jgi:hypothetical protein
VADNVTANPGSGGATFAADDVSGVLFPYAKLDIGGDGASSPVTASNPLPVSGPLTDTQLRASPVPSGVPQASSVVIMSLTTAATGSNYTAFSSQTCNSLDIVNSSSVAIEYRRGATGNAMTILSGSSRLVAGITNANQIDVRRTDLSNTQITIPAEAITV